MNSIDQELIEMAAENNLPEVHRLLSVGADVNANGDDDWTPLHYASCEGHVVKEFMKHGAGIEATTIPQDSTPLNLACCNGHLAVVIKLFGHRADIAANTDSKNGKTYCILGKRKSRGGAGTEAKDRYGNTPLHLVSGVTICPL
jgi:ankyrin repeat protein